MKCKNNSISDNIKYGNLISSTKHALNVLLTIFEILNPFIFCECWFDTNPPPKKSQKPSQTLMKQIYICFIQYIDIKIVILPWLGLRIPYKNPNRRWLQQSTKKIVNHCCCCWRDSSRFKQTMDHQLAIQICVRTRISKKLKTYHTPLIQILVFLWGWYGSNKRLTLRLATSKR